MEKPPDTFQTIDKVFVASRLLALIANNGTDGTIRLTVFMTNYFWLRYGFMGFLVPAIPFLFLNILARVGASSITVWFCILIFYLERPIVIFGRGMNLPIETGGVAFLMYELNPFGYLLVFLFWTIVGLFIGVLADFAKVR